jgi:dipeptidyl aminopeptidase/acylaminoacyl peptidase
MSASQPAGPGPARPFHLFLLPVVLLLGGPLLPAVAPGAAPGVAPWAGGWEASAQTTSAGDRPALDLPRDYILPPATVQELFSRDPNHAVLDHPSPDGRRFLVPLRTELSTLEHMGQETYRLAEMELRPRTDRLWHLDTFGIHGLRIYDLEDRAFRDVSLPEGSFISDLMWSPDGSQVAFLAHLREGTEVWVAEAATGRAGPVSSARVMATLGTTSAGQGSRPSRMLQWTPRGSLLTLLVPGDRGPEPARPTVPPGPIVRTTRPEPTPTRTFPFLLRDAHDETLFEHYTRSQLAELVPGETPRPIGAPAQWESIELSPDGVHVMAVALHRPFSFLTSFQGFPRRRVVMDLEGNELAVLEERPLREASGPEGDDDPLRPREWRWRPDGAGLIYLQREGENGDRIRMVTAPFDTASAVTLARSGDRLGNPAFDARGRFAFASLTRNGGTGLVVFPLGGDDPEPVVLVEPERREDPTALPGDLWARAPVNGVEEVLVSSDGEWGYLRGEGYRADFRPRPFVDRVALDGRGTERVFEGAGDHFDRPLVALDPDLERMVVSREAKSVFPDSHLWTAGGGLQENLTRNRDPFPEITAAERMDFEFTRRDGLRVQGRVSLPVDHVAGTRVPAIFWTYPREYTRPEEYERAAIRSRNHNAFHHLTWLRWSDIWLTQGYAVVYPDIPIVGENYNDTYIANLSDAMYAAIRAVDELGVVDIDRIGHGGHSYGAFATVNLLAHTPYFQAGIAGHGAYNRSLTPSGFQAERRILWEAPHTYLDISPFFKADQINAPLLMYHGGDDNNTGTWPMQSERLMHALTTLGKEAALFVYPYESHTPRALENNLDMWARWLDWFDTHVKGAEGALLTDHEAGEGGGR